MTADSPASVAPGDSVALTNIQQSRELPGTIFLAGYNLGLLTVGPNTIPATRGDDDRGHEHGRGDAGHQRGVDLDLDHDQRPRRVRRAPAMRPATDGSFSVTYNDQTWTAGPRGTINFREDTVPIGAGAGRCTPAASRSPRSIRRLPDRSASAAAPAPSAGRIRARSRFDDPAVSFASTSIEVPANQPPTADAGPDQTVASEADVNLDGTGSSIPTPATRSPTPGPRPAVRR